MRRLVVCRTIVLVLLLGGCQQQQRITSPPSILQDRDSITFSLLGRPLYAPELTEELREKRERDLLQAQAEYDTDPHDEQAIIWLGRRLAYLGRFQDAIDVFSNGLAIHPDSYRLLRHRGHRYITIRRFDLAQADLARAAELVRSIPDEVEPDGAPNRLGIPTSTSHTNIYYHLGLAKYLAGDFGGAIHAYRSCLEFSKNDDMRVATLYWLYLAHSRVGESKQAQKTLALVSPEMTVIENHSYLLLLRLFRGDILSFSLEQPNQSDGDVAIDRATVGYGVAVRDLTMGHRAVAELRFTQIVEDPNLNWAAFGFIAAEAELARMRALKDRDE